MMDRYCMEPHPRGLGYLVFDRLRGMSTSTSTFEVAPSKALASCADRDDAERIVRLLNADKEKK